MYKIRELLTHISKLSIQLEECEFATDIQKKDNWLGYEPTKDIQICAAEERLNIKFPEDYKDFLRITNGFSAPNTIEPSFMKIEDIDYLKKLDHELIQIWGSYEGLEDDTFLLRESLLIAGIHEEQYFLLVPPNIKSDKWRYLKFAAWYPGIVEQTDLETYFNEVLDFIENNK